LRKGRPSITLSPLNHKPRDKSQQQPSINDISTAKASFFGGGKSEKTFSRQGSNLDLGSLNETATTKIEQFAKDKDQICSLIRKKVGLFEEGSEREFNKNNNENVPPEIYNNEEMAPMTTKSSKSLLRRAIGREGSLSTCNGKLPKLKRDNSKENGSMYIKLNETKEWRKKIFKKTSKGSMILESRPMNEDRYIIDVDGPIKIEG